MKEYDCFTLSNFNLGKINQFALSKGYPPPLVSFTPKDETMQNAKNSMKIVRLNFFIGHIPFVNFFLI